MDYLNLPTPLNLWAYSRLKIIKENRVSDIFGHPIGFYSFVFPRASFQRSMRMGFAFILRASVLLFNSGAIRNFFIGFTQEPHGRIKIAKDFYLPVNATSFLYRDTICFVVYNGDDKTSFT